MKDMPKLRRQSNKELIHIYARFVQIAKIHELALWVSRVAARTRRWLVDQWLFIKQLMTQFYYKGSGALVNSTFLRSTLEKVLPI